MPDPPVFQAVHEYTFLLSCVLLPWPCRRQDHCSAFPVCTSRLALVWQDWYTTGAATAPSFSCMFRRPVKHLFLLSYLLSLMGNAGLETWEWALLVHKITFWGRWNFLFSESGHVYPSEISYRNKLFTTDHRKCGYDVEHTSKLILPLRCILFCISQVLNFCIKKSVTRYSCHYMF